MNTVGPVSRRFDMRRLALALPLAVLLLGACSTTTSGTGVSLEGASTSRQEMVRRQVAEMKYLHGEVLLTRMQSLASMGVEAVPALTEGASSEDWLVRSSCMWIFGVMGDRQHVPVVAARLTDESAVVRYEAATSLVKLGDSRGFRTLVDGLADEDLRNRYKCFRTLRQATGRDFGYRHDGEPQERRQAVGRWLDWVDGISPSAL